MRAAHPRFSGFHPEAFRFFRRLARNNRKPWFDRHRHTYDQHVSGALRALFEELVPFVLSLDDGFEISGKTGRNFSRINRDIRFARDKSPYRRNLYLYFGPRNAPGRDARLYLGLSAEGVTCGLALYGGRESSLEQRLKPRRARRPEDLEQHLRRLAPPPAGRARRYEIYWHRHERGEWKKYPGSPRTEKDWKYCRAWVLRKRFAPSRRELRSARFTRSVEKVFDDLFPLYAFATVDGPLGERALRARRRR